MNYRPDLVALDSINGSIEHSVDEVGIGMATYGWCSKLCRWRCLKYGAAPDNTLMKQQDLGLNLSKRRTRKAVFLDEMNLVVPWS